MDTAMTIHLTRLCIQITNTVGFFFQSFTHQTYKEIQSKKYINSKPKVLSNSNISYLAVLDYGHSSLNRPTRSIIRHKIVFPDQLTMFAGILLKHFDIYINENCVKKTVANIYLPVKIFYLSQIFIIFERVQISKV